MASNKILTSDTKSGIQADPVTGTDISNASKRGLDVVSFAGTTVIDNNSTITPLNAGQTFVGQWQERLQSDILIAIQSDRSATIAVEFSTNQVDVDETYTFSFEPTILETPHRLVVTRRYFRVSVTNISALDMTYLRLQVSSGAFGPVSSPLNRSIDQDVDTIVVRSIPADIDIVNNKYDGYSIVTKFGRISDIDSGSVPEDVWNGGGTYTGFPTGAPEEFEVFSTSASDTGVITFLYLPSATSTRYLVGTATLNGTTPVATGITGFRMHSARYNSGSSTGFNVGEITIRHRTTTANVFCVMPIGRSQTYVSGYRVPNGSTGYIRRVFCRVGGATTGFVDGAIWVRSNGGSPRLRRPFSAAQQDHFEEMPYGGLVIEQNSDIIIRVLSASANNLEIIAGYDLLLVRN